MSIFIALCGVMLAVVLFGLILSLFRLAFPPNWREAERVREAEIFCDGCKHYLGGGCCRINLEKECADGDYEAWEESEHAER